MAQNGRFSLGVRVLALLAADAEAMQTSTTLAEALGTSPVMVRRIFGALHAAGFIQQRKGPAGGAKLKKPAKEIGLGDVYAAVGSDWPQVDEKTIDTVLKRVHQDSLKAMNETTIANVAKKLKKT
jgi:Rrf2 family protein